MKQICSKTDGGFFKVWAQNDLNIEYTTFVGIPVKIIIIKAIAGGEKIATAIHETKLGKHDVNFNKPWTLL